MMKRAYLRFRSWMIAQAQKFTGAVYATRLKKYPELASLLRRLRSGAKSTGVSVADAIALYEHVLFRKPQIILELGAGQSSAVIALAARTAGYLPRFIAAEESAEWLAHHRETNPVDLMTNIELIQRNTDAKQSCGQRSAFYVDLPRLAYEFVHVDGPDHFKRQANVSCDILDLLPDLGRSCIIIFDGREASARMAASDLTTRGFRMRRHPATWSYEFVRD